MNSLKFKPEGWNNEVTELNYKNINDYINTNEILQGVVKECDDNYNLHIQFENGMTGIIPRKEIEAINIDKNGIPKNNLCTGKVHKFIQFKIKEANDLNNIILSRKEVQQEAIQWVKNDLREGEKLTRYSKEHKAIWSFY